GYAWSLLLRWLGPASLGGLVAIVVLLVLGLLFGLLFGLLVSPDGRLALLAFEVELDLDAVGAARRVLRDAEDLVGRRVLVGLALLELLLAQAGELVEELEGRRPLEAV